MKPYAWASIACGITTALAAALLHIFDLSNVIMVFLLTVVGISIQWGRGPGAWAAALSVLLFDFFFVPPKFSFAVSDVQYLFTFTLMLFVALVIGQLTAKLKNEVLIAQLRERRAEALAELSKELSAALTAEQVIEIALRHLSEIFHTAAAVFLPDRNNILHSVSQFSQQLTLDNTIAQWVYDHQEAAGFGTQTLSAAKAHYLPLKAPMRTRGVLVLAAEKIDLFTQPENQRLLDTFAAQTALALERVHYVEVAQEALVSMEGEKLRNALLSAISHDLRTPLTVLVGLASTLVDQNPSETTRKELALAIQTEAQQMNELVTNLLDMVRLQTGGVKLKIDWQSMEEIVGSACAQSTRLLAQHKLTVSIPAHLPLCECDPILIQRVIINLLDNAVKFTPLGSAISIRVSAAEASMMIMVEDNGPGLPPGQEKKLFDKFTRGEVESNKPGVGLGLALCKAIIEAHKGRIFAENSAHGGARFIISLPLRKSPMPGELA